MNRIKARAVGSASGAFTCWLVVVMSAGLLQVACSDCDDEIFLMLQNSKLTYKHVEEILKRLPDTMWICGATVGQYLKFRDTACELEGLTDAHFGEPGGRNCCENPYGTRNYKSFKSNLGLLKFVNHYALARKQSCAAKLVPFYKRAEAELSDEDKKNVKRLNGGYGRDTFDALPPSMQNYHENLPSNAPIARAHWHYFAEYQAQISRQSNHKKDFSSCIALIKVLKNFLPKLAVINLEIHNDYTKLWNQRMSSCRSYVLCFCLTHSDKKRAKGHCDYAPAPYRLSLSSNEKAMCEEAKDVLSFKA